MNKTNISWTDFTWNPITGCSVASDGCKNCYAKIVHERFYDTPFSDVVFHKNRLSEPSKRKKSAKIFIGSMTDLFQDEISFEKLSHIFDEIVGNPQHIFQLLTKRPERMKEYFDWYYNHGYSTIPNLYIGVTAENQKEADIRIPTLLDIRAVKRFVSIEPMIGEINLRMSFWDKDDALHYADFLIGKDYQSGGYNHTNKLDWVIVGGESGVKSKVREMKLEWVERVYNDCKDASTPFFFKQWGAIKPKDSYSFENIQEEA